MINKLRETNKKLLEDSKDEKYVLIKKILDDDKCFFKMDIESAFSILRDLKIKEDNLQNVYEELIDIKNFV